MSAAPSRASSFLSHWVKLPSPGGSPYTTTSTTPPRVSPSLRAASTSAIIRALVSASAQRTGSSSMRARSAGSGTGVPSGTATEPSATTCETISTPRACASSFRATSPSATRAAVSRALARSRMGRASACPNFCMPARSAWPGRGRVSGALRACSSSSSRETGSGDMTVSHLGHSVLPTRMATGPPSVTPCRTPPVSSTSSCSNFIRAPRP